MQVKTCGFIIKPPMSEHYRSRFVFQGLESSTFSKLKKNNITQELLLFDERWKFPPNHCLYRYMSRYMSIFRFYKFPMDEQYAICFSIFFLSVIFIFFFFVLFPFPSIIFTHMKWSFDKKFCCHFHKKKNN